MFVLRSEAFTTKFTKTIRSSLPPSPSSRLYSKQNNHFDVIVVGGGHAGCEAAAAACRRGAQKVALVTQRLDTIGELSCNPSIGGIGKGHLVKEIDALDGLMGRVADEAGIHYRILNRRKGPAVRGPRAQMDRDLYKEAMQRTLQDDSSIYKDRLTLIEASVEDLLYDERKAKSSVITSSSGQTTANIMNGVNGNYIIPQNDEDRFRIQGVEIKKNDDNESSEELYAPSVVITTGTFLRGMLLLGHDRFAGGRQLRTDEDLIEPPSVGLAHTFMEKFKFQLGRLKTGTPARINGDTIDWSVCPIQPTENPATPFSFLAEGRNPRNIAADRIIACHQSATNDKTHELVLKYEDTLPRYDGGLDGTGNGPRYCPSIYKKVQRFPERKSHNCFLEPEGLNTNLVYPNGMSGPYPPEIQLEILRTMKGLEEVEIIKPGYDVEYDFCNPLHTIGHTLETKLVKGLYLAGQICGTTGYEEAAAQGIMAGANAASSNEPFILGRDEAYIGVLIDDLVTRGTTEPYRMFTSRAEYRISLRQDNADLRLTEKAAQAGLIASPDRMQALKHRQDEITTSLQQLNDFSLKVTDWAEQYPETMGYAKKDRTDKKTAVQVLQMPHVTLDQILSVADIDIPFRVADTVEAMIKYQAYEESQQRDMESWRKAQGMTLPATLVYSQEHLPTLSAEELEKLNLQRPRTLADAAKISGITPQSLVYLHQHVNKIFAKQKQQQKENLKEEEDLSSRRQQHAS
eukprot:CAMPEP_0178897756 /NCGR_PEP_ID=MMETSP0786-20121207/1933_1 /TAXON_ID=186022 /ORGANISM="Thalassionema frauenfeldii, Strain CCMP 1798" /LENGTH=742 /DNA_ID=CAMNT_0020568361 /DNA_START=162 /DNA_END=2390 /DNA_ORIENTATION=-